MEIDPMFLERWSRRSISDAPLSRDIVRALFEAARWAPSASNSQPWLFVYANDPETLANVRELIRPSNQRWALRAPLLVFVFARKFDPETRQPLRTGAFDTGAAWFSLALQGAKLGLVTHAMGGIHHEKTFDVLGVPESEFESMAAIAIGYPAAKDVLPEDLANRETPSQRKPQHEFAFHGRYVPPAAR
ncbi:MAG TPA: nitroreductase family protein [Polyangiaceae bacterium]|nr:nitroreductase family protein [Polyangiaceae bacterium]